MSSFFLKCISYCDSAKEKPFSYLRWHEEAFIEMTDIACLEARTNLLLLILNASKRELSWCYTF